MERYSRQMLFSGIKETGQQKLSQARVAIVGLGALGSAQAEQLARAGVGTLRLLDRDVLEPSNLQRQCLYDEQQVAQRLPKAIAAKQRLQQINSTIEIDAQICDLSPLNVESILQDIDLVLDATDNFETRFLLNDACIKLQIPWIYGACVSSYGLVMTILPGQTPCLRCMFEEAPPPGTMQTCDTAGVIGPIVATIAALQCAEALKYLVGAKEALRKGILHVDLWDNRFHPVELTSPRPECPSCQKHQWSYLEGKHNQQTAVLCGRNTVQVMPAQPTQLDLQQLSTKLAAHGQLTRNPFLIRLELPERTLTIFPDGRALVEGTKDALEARSLYARYIGV